MDSIDHCVQDDDYNDLSNYEPEVPTESRKTIEVKQECECGSELFNVLSGGRIRCSKCGTIWNRRTDPVKAKLFEALVVYGVHKHDCICSQWRKGTPTDEPGYDGYKTLYGYGKNEKWYGRNEDPPCSCGLREAITAYEKEQE